ncbi:MAG TPA: response regulator [Candidatus Lokiarchaeia archaeon]|nr:response regulator [Candidatus Lokiarchaeia archaeon]
MENKYTILVVDDDVGMLETMMDILSELNFTVTTADDGFKAIEMARDGTFDAILLDVRMPRIDGIETLKRIKAIKPNAKIILLTAYTSETTVLDALKEGASEILYKPVDFNQLGKLLNP